MKKELTNILNSDNMSFQDMSFGGLEERMGVMPRRRERHSLTEPAFLVLLSIAEHPLHGYAIKKRVEELSKGRIRLSTGTLYGAIKRFLDAKWIEAISRATHPEEESTRTRRKYRLTGQGNKVLSDETQRLHDLTAATVKAGAILRPSNVEGVI